MKCKLCGAFQLDAESEQRQAAYDAERQRREAAEADNAAVREAGQKAYLEALAWIHDQLDGTSSLKDELSKIKPLQEVLWADHPGSRFLELAQIVEGLPKYRGEIVLVQDNIVFWSVNWRGSDGNLELVCDHMNKLEADALARLLAWRSKE